MVMLSVLQTILLRSTFDQRLIKIFQIVQESWNGHERVMVDELIDRWAEDAHFHNPLSELRLGLKRHSEAV